VEVRELKVIYEPLRLVHHHNLRVDLSKPGAAIHLAASILGNEPNEVMGIFCLTTRCRVLCYHEVSRGGLDKCPASPREIFRPALLANAAALILLHNHPSGDPSPSKEDVAVTDRLTKAGELLCLQVLDHIIVGDSRHYSFVEARMMPNQR
jgi:DNA repair protein RadC